MATRRLVVDDGNTSAAIVSLLETMPAADQTALLASLVPAPAPSLDKQIAVQPVEIRERLAARYFTRSALRRCRLQWPALDQRPHHRLVTFRHRT